MPIHPVAAATTIPRSDSESPQLTVVVPTFNEAGNVDELLRRLDAALSPAITAEVIFVDDSTDETPDVIAAAVGAHRLPVRLIHRDRPTGGLGGAVVEGLRAARSPWAVVMDGDLQHPPSVVPTLLEAGRSSAGDVVVATRYIDGGSNDGLDGSYRRRVSTSTKALAAAVLGGPVGAMSDPLSGFFAVRVAALSLDEVNPIGYKILLELIVRSDLRRIAEVPFTFAARHSGESKSSLREGLRYLRHLVHLRRAQRIRTAAEHARPASTVHPLPSRAPSVTTAAIDTRIAA
jgi:glycosyltransferase involved in cell wall biosynthesis